ncbi:hypothetical protein HanRHA438_Chr09g0419061 [Helianthus annuus]|uniref:Uncharacterized protein n=1 Tax=Helianthus annuus TaxID=4232 RepID=A0A251U626_HELAN|nr:hypothetical protein HanRHA438_Chr09g0419061 [Helianthus annuus]
MVGCLNSCDCLTFNSHENGVGCDIWTRKWWIVRFVLELMMMMNNFMYLRC